MLDIIPYLWYNINTKRMEVQENERIQNLWGNQMLESKGFGNGGDMRGKGRRWYKK